MNVKKCYIILWYLGYCEIKVLEFISCKLNWILFFLYFWILDKVLNFKKLYCWERLVLRCCLWYNWSKMRDKYILLLKFMLLVMKELFKGICYV